LGQFQKKFMLQRYSLLIIGLSGIIAVILGAFGAHAWRETLTSRGSLHAWETAVYYQFIHTVALLAMALATPGLRPTHRQPFIWTTRFWMTGIVLFSGSIYALSMGGPKMLGPVTPLGGLAFILGWTALIFEARRLHKVE
jgi:uncharacterized membrane protein YgdD (TMEM256/DUF423 family)